jgi:triosephosphate isomerase (TIM)
MRKPIVAGNWKMNGSRERNAALLEGLTHGLEDGVACEVLVCPPSVYLADTARTIRGSAIALGAQDLCAEPQGAYTGQVAADMLIDLGCSYALVGHSERRQIFHEDDALVVRKFMAAQAAGLIPVLCLGETLEEREAERTGEVVSRQLGAVVAAVGIAAFERAVLAYEPVWAIGTGRTASPEQAQEVHALLRGLLAEDDGTIASSTRLLYGGSVKAANAAELFAMPDVDGGLVGGASLQADEFLEICRAA